MVNLRLLGCLILALAAPAAFGAATITGTVYNSTGNLWTNIQVQLKPLTGVQVISGDFIAPIVQSTLTDVSGQFSFTAIQGDYSIVIAGVVSQTISVPSSGTYNFVDLITPSVLTYIYRYPGALVKISATDTNFNFLSAKLTNSTPLVITTNLAGADEQLVWSIPRGTNDVHGYLHTNDWQTFNAKQTQSANLDSVSTGGGNAANWNAGGTTNSALYGAVTAHSGTFTNALATGGTLDAGSVVSAAGVTAAASSGIGFNSRSTFLSGSDGAAEVKNNAQSDWATWKAKTLTLSGTTNQVVFGGTNTVPASSAAPTKWISVQVAGESVVYRLPLYE